MVTVFTKIVTKVELLCEIVLVLEEVDVTTENKCGADDCNDEDGLLLSLALVLTAPGVEEVVDRICEVEAPIELGLSLVDPFCDVLDKRVLMSSFEEVVPVVIIPDNDPDIVNDKILASVLWACEFEDAGIELELRSPVALTGGFWAEVPKKVLLLAVVLLLELLVESGLVVVALWLSEGVTVKVPVSDPAMFELTPVKPLFNELALVTVLFFAPETVIETVDPWLEVEV